MNWVATLEAFSQIALVVAMATATNDFLELYTVERPAIKHGHTQNYIHWSRV